MPTAHRRNRSHRNPARVFTSSKTSNRYDYVTCTVYSVTSALARITSAPDLVDAIAQTAWRGGGSPARFLLTLVADTALTALIMKLRYYLLALHLWSEKAVGGFLLPLTSPDRQKAEGKFAAVCV